MEVVFKHTNQLSRQELSQISALFETVFEKPRPIDLLLRQYVNNPIGYSYHSLLIDNNQIKGLNSYVPVYYRVNGKKLLFANSIDSMVDKNYRDFFNFKDIVTTAYNNMQKEGVAFVYGYPNDNSFPVLTKSKLMKEIGKMYTYCLPIHVGAIKSSLRFLNPLSEILCKTWVITSKIFANTKSINFQIEKDSESYNTTRYLRNDGKYNIVNIGDGITAYYKIQLHENVRSAFLIDVSEKSSRAFNRAVWYILKNHSKEFDILLYPGWLPFSNTGMTRIPRKLEPKNFNFAGKILNKEVIPDIIWDISNWDTNLSNYDLI